MSGIQSKSEGEYVPSPRPNPRLRPEGAAYAERNRGTMERWFDYSDTMNSDGGPPPKNNHDAVMDNGHHYGDGDVGVSKVTEQYAQLSVSRTPAEEAREYAMRNRGQLDHVINHYRVDEASLSFGPAYAQDTSTSQDTTPSDSRSPPTSPSHHNAPSQSPRQRTLHQESQGRAWDETRPAPRIRPGEGESIAAKNTSDSMFDIMRTGESKNASVDNVSGKVGSGVPHQTSSPVKAAGTAPAMPQGLHSSQESAPGEPSAAQPRARPGEGRRNYERAHNQSEMSAIMRGEGDGGCNRNQRNSRHLQRSELW